MSRASLDNTLECRGFLIAAVVRTGVEVHAVDGRLVGWGQKVPLALLIANGEGIAALDLQGQALDRDQIEALAPGCWAAFDAAAQQHSR